jgi:Uma2 family endonuclease
MATVESRNILSPGMTGSKVVPELCAGDQLTRAEFERRYAAMPNVKKAELIEGEVYMPSPVSRKHAGPHAKIIAWLVYYWSATQGVESGDNATVRLDLENEPQPDGFLRILPQCGGQSWDDDEYIGGAPELVAEIAVSGVNIDLHKKLRVYQRNGVREYLVWRVSDVAIDWFGLREGRFEHLPTSETGVCRSEVFPGLWLDSAALLRGDFARVMAVLQEGIASPEHAAFVARLAAAVGTA